MFKEEITIPSWFLERIEDTLRIQYNINLDKKTGETCQDRNIKECLNGVRKLLKGEELTGGERLERLQPSLPSNLDEAAEENFETMEVLEHENIFEETHRKIFKAGAEWMAGQGVTKEAVIGMSTEEITINVSQQTLNELDLCPGDNVVVQIRKK